MSLKIKRSWKTILSDCAWAVFLMLIAVFTVRVFCWEDQYYASKEGSVRAVAATESEEEEGRDDVDETEVTEEVIREYTVAADRPRYISIPRLEVWNARVIAVGLLANSELGTPNNIFDAGWYYGSGKPGQGGTMLIDGHNGGPTKIGIFKFLPRLNVGDIITIERGDGEKFDYEVVENESVLLSEANAYMKKAMKSPVEGKESLTIITCTGEWSQLQGTYLSRQFLRATLVEE